MIRFNHFLIQFFIFIFLTIEGLSQENKILFKLNNEIVTSIDLLNEINYLKSINNEYANASDDITYNVAKNSIIREKIKEIEILNYVNEINIDEKILNNVLMSNFGYLDIKSISEFNEYFLNRNINPSIIKKKLSIEILWNQIIFQKYNNQIKIDTNEIKKNLLNKKQREFLLKEILFELNDGEKLNQKYNLIKKTISERNFSQAALLYSVSDTSKNEGKIGWIKETTINKKILNKLNNVKIGDYSEPILVPGGFLILKIEDQREIKKNINLEVELNKVIDDKKNQQLNQFSNIYFNKVKKDIFINEL
tara:strand:- start:567 stop:1490 length:924 start_codon:yes stop_codon:yes gene_type:complete